MSGLRALWEGTGRGFYLDDGHNLVKSVISATGWTRHTSTPTSNKEWSGLGRKGIIEDYCDASGSCSQDAQTFKSIFFHHLALFCELLPLSPRAPGKTHAADKTLAKMHHGQCKAYLPWVAHNAKAALKSQNADGRFGMWWGGGDHVEEAVLPEEAVDYRNHQSLLVSDRWKPQVGSDWTANTRLPQDTTRDLDPPGHAWNKAAIRTSRQDRQALVAGSDLNDRGRGRTVETQAGGVAVLRCLWELQHM